MCVVQTLVPQYKTPRQMLVGSLPPCSAAGPPAAQEAGFLLTPTPGRFGYDASLLPGLPPDVQALVFQYAQANTEKERVREESSVFMLQVLRNLLHWHLFFVVQKRKARRARRYSKILPNVRHVTPSRPLARLLAML